MSEGNLSLLVLSLPLLKIPIIKQFPFFKVEPFDNKIFEFGLNIELKISSTAGDELLIP